MLWGYSNKWLQCRFVKSCTAAMTVCIAMPEPIAADFDCAPTVLAEALPSRLIAADTIILDRLYDLQIPKFLTGENVFQLTL